MTHYPSLEQSVRDRLEARGIDPERSTTAFLLAIRDGSFPIRDGLPSPPRVAAAGAETRFEHGIPLAVVLTEVELERRRQALPATRLRNFALWQGKTQRRAA